MKNKIIFKTLMLKGEAGSTIVSMEKTGHVGTADIYTITFNDGSTTEISLENMSAITSVEKTSSTDTEDIYTITCADGSTQTFSVLNHNADIAAMYDDIDTIDARVDNFINSVVPNTVETLWTGSIEDVGDSATLSKAVSNFDYIDLYLLGSADSKYIRVPATQTAVQIQQQNLSDDASSNFLRLWEMGVSISGSTVSITKVIAWAWDDPDNSNPTVTDNAQNGVPITRIDGVKVASDTPAEVTDIRVGADGTTYNSAGAAVRGQISDLKEDLSYIGNWGTFIKGSGSVAVPFEFIQGHKYTVTNKSVSGTINFNLADTPTGSALQTIYGLDAGVTKTFIANQNAHYINGWQASSQTFFIVDNSSKVIEWDNYQNQIDDMLMLKTPYDLTEGGYDATDGTITPNQYYSYTDFIDISQFGMLRVVSPNGALNYCTWYKEDKTTGIRFIVAQGDNTLYAPAGYKYARLSAGTSTITGISIYTGLWFNGAITREYLDGVKDLLPNRYVATRSTAGTTDYFDYNVVKGHSYLLVNPNGFACSFTPKSADGTNPEIGATTISPNSVNMRVSEVDGFCNCYFAGDNGTLYIYDMDGESIRKTITDLNGDAVDAIVSSRYKNSATPHLLTLVHFSDIHADSTSLRRIINFNSDMEKYIDDTICTGDIVSSKFGDSLDFWTSSDGAEKILTCMGNHDSYYTNSMDEEQMVSMSDVANKFIAPFESDWGTISRPTGCTYYYKDYDSGYRLIVLDAIRIDTDATAEATWLTNALADAKTNNLAVIIAMHYMPTGSMHVYDCQFSKFNMFGDQQNICNAPEFDVQGIVQNFIDGGGVFMCYLIGHLHRDIFGYVYGYPKQPCIMVTTSNAEKASLEINADLGRAIGTKMQDAFNAVTFDKDSGIIKVIRIGADVDNVMRPRKAISYIVQSGAFPMN